MKLSLTLFALVSADARLKRETTFVGDDGGKWVKCEALIAQMDVNGELNCAGDVCSVNCTDGFVVEGPTKAKCIKGANDQWFFNKDLGVCVEAFNPEDEFEDGGDDDKPEPEDPEPDVAGDDGKWQKCDPTPIDNGKISCIGAKCTLFCKEGFMVEGSANAKCMKNAAGVWKFNKQLGSCVTIPDDIPVDQEDGNPGCKSLGEMIQENSSLDIACKINGKGQFICNLDCPEGTLFMGKEGKTGTKLTCKCKGEKCKWKNDFKKIVNGKKMKAYKCE